MRMAFLPAYSVTNDQQTWNDDGENNLIFFWPYWESKQEIDDEKFLIWSEIKEKNDKKIPTRCSLEAHA